MTRPANKIKAERSHILVWKGTDPHLETSHWMPGYTEAHTETKQEALAHAITDVMQETALIREKWIKLQLLVETEQHKAIAEGYDSFGQALQQDADREAEMDDWAGGGRLTSQ